jgi:hypothetical protein
VFVLRVGRQEFADLLFSLGYRDFYSEAVASRRYLRAGALFCATMPAEWALPRLAPNGTMSHP